jgi:hypothetical protein
MSAHRPGLGHAACACPACRLEGAVSLLETGRIAPALRLLRELPGAIREAVAAARAEGVRDGRRTRPAKPPARPAKSLARPTASRPGPASRADASKPGFQRSAAELARHVERLGPERVAEMLRVDAADLAPLLEGRVGIAKAALDRLRRAG